MIVTVTLNPALHVGYRMRRLDLHADNDISQVSHWIGGQGLAIARVLQEFGHEVLAAGLAGGATGELIRTELARAGVPSRFTSIGRESRRVIDVRDGDGGLTRFAEPAPYITTEELGRFAADYRGLLAGAVAVVLSGSLAAGLPPESYGTLATYAAEAGVPAVIDAGGTPLRQALSRQPALVIPDPAAVPVPSGTVPAFAGADGAGQALPGEPGGPGPAALVAAGVGAVVTTAGGQVQVVTRDGEWRAAAPADAARPGAREALVAGLVPGLVLGWSWPDRLRHAVALAASALPGGDVDLEAYERLLPTVPVSGP